MKHFQLSDEASVDMEAPMRKKALVQKLKLFNKLKQGKQQIKPNENIISPENLEKKNPSVPPINNDGAKIPPIPPEPMVSEVAITLNSTKQNKNSSIIEPLSVQFPKKVPSAILLNCWL